MTTPVEPGHLFATTRPLASVREYLSVPGSADPQRALAVRLMNGLDFEVLASRGFDIGDAYYRGQPLSWFSPVSDHRALSFPTGSAWLARFAGGLLTTCGLENIGPPTGLHGLHGDFAHLPAEQISSWTGVPSGAPTVSLSGFVNSSRLFGPSFGVRRTISASAALDGTSWIRVQDEITNTGVEPASLKMLYHLNFGPPLVVPGSTVLIESDRVVEREPQDAVPDWSVLPHMVDHTAEAVFEHDAVRSHAGLASATVVNPDASLTALVEWSAVELPRLYQWVLPTRGRWALAIEPSTAPLFGPDRDSLDADALVLAPGRTRQQEIRITLSDRQSRGVPLDRRP